MREIQFCLCEVHHHVVGTDEEIQSANQMKPWFVHLNLCVLTCTISWANSVNGAQYIGFQDCMILHTSNSLKTISLANQKIAHSSDLIIAIDFFAILIGKLCSAYILFESHFENVGTTWQNDNWHFSRAKAYYLYIERYLYIDR